MKNVICKNIEEYKKAKKLIIEKHVEHKYCLVLKENLSKATNENKIEIQSQYIPDNSKISQELINSIILHTNMPADKNAINIINNLIDLVIQNSDESTSNSFKKLIVTADKIENTILICIKKTNISSTIWNNKKELDILFDILTKFQEQLDKFTEDNLADVKDFKNATLTCCKDKSIKLINAQILIDNMNQHAAISIDNQNQETQNTQDESEEISDNPDAF